MSDSRRQLSAEALAEILSARLRAGGVPELDSNELAAEGRPGWTGDAISAALEALADRKQLHRAQRLTCPAQACGRLLSPADVEAAHCPYCGADFRETGEEPVARTIYVYAGPRSRDLEWAIVIHGMNTLGPWQEELSWRLSNQYRYSAPVLIYKYGLIRLGVLFRFRHRALVRALGHRIQNAAAWAASYDRRRPPDVILHSFATLMFAKLLEMPEFKDLRFGRVILAGSIVRPDHSWAIHVGSGRVEALLNHCGSRDHIVELAALAIPDTGPSGRIGFRDASTINVCTVGYDHSTYFQDRGLKDALADEGLWERFLRLPLAALNVSPMDSGLAQRWRPLPFPLRRAALWLLPLLVVGALALLDVLLRLCCPALLQ